MLTTFLIGNVAFGFSWATGLFIGHQIKFGFGPSSGLHFWVEA